jgi:trimethylamine--corrinoid protein Co-methyltransferase
VTGGRAARQAARLAAHVEGVPYLTRTLTPFEVLSEEGLSLIEDTADTILERVGIDVREAPDAVDEELREWIERQTASLPGADV